MIIFDVINSIKMRIILNRSILIILAIQLLFPVLGFPSSETFKNSVTVEIPSYLFIEGDKRDLNFSFDDYRAGTETQSQSVVYTIMGNSFTQSEGAPAVTARLDGIFPDIDFRARMEAYTKEGGNAELGAASGDFISVGQAETILAKKANATGDGKLLRGQMQVAYKAVATSSLKAGTHSQQLTLTLTDV